MVHSAAVWVYRALEFIRAYACVKTPLDVAVGTNFTRVNTLPTCMWELACDSGTHDSPHTTDVYMGAHTTGVNTHRKHTCERKTKTKKTSQ